MGYGPDPAACIELLRRHDALCVAGNHDLAVSGRMGLEWFNEYAAEAARWTMGQLDDTDAEYLRGLPLQMELHGFTAVHGSPRDPVWEYVVNSAAALAAFKDIGTPSAWSDTPTYPSYAGSKAAPRRSGSRLQARWIWKTDGQ